MISVFQQVTDKLSRKAFKKTLTWAADPTMMSVPFTALAVAKAHRGEKLATFGSTAGGLMAFPTFQRPLAMGLELIPGIGPTAAIALATVAAIFPTIATENYLSRKFRQFTKAGRQIRSLETGQDFRDNEFQARRRDNAFQELAATVQSSRRYLGQEARFMHR